MTPSDTVLSELRREVQEWIEAEFPVGNRDRNQLLRRVPDAQEDELRRTIALFESRFAKGLSWRIFAPKNVGGLNG